MFGSADETRSIHMNLDGWFIDGVPLKEFDQSRKKDDTLRIAALTLIPNHVIEKERKNVMETLSIDDITVSKLGINQNVLREVFRSGPEFCPLAEGDILGMSLGETILSFLSHSDIYRKDSWQLVAYHKILKGNKIWWVKLMSGVLNNNYYTNAGTREQVRHALMEIL